MVLVRAGTEEATWPLAAEGVVDLDLVNDLARLQLVVGRAGCSIRLRQPAADLTALLDLVGLRMLLVESPAGDRQMGGLAGDLQVGGQPEGGEEVRVEEVVVPDDPVA